jgi:hypothetical protein
LQDVEALDDEDVRATHDHLGRGDDVVAQVRVERRAHFLHAALHIGDEPEERTAIVGLGEALPVHDAAALELGVRVEEAIGRDEFDMRGVRPLREQLAQEARDRGLADGYGSGHTDDERRAVAVIADELARGTAEVLRVLRIEAQQPAERQVDLLDLAHVESVAESADLDDVGLTEREAGGGGEPCPLRSVDLHVRRCLALGGPGRCRTHASTLPHAWARFRTDPERNRANRRTATNSTVTSRAVRARPRRRPRRRRDDRGRRR